MLIPLFARGYSYTQSTQSVQVPYAIRTRHMVACRASGAPVSAAVVNTGT